MQEAAWSGETRVPGVCGLEAENRLITIYYPSTEGLKAANRKKGSFPMPFFKSLPDNAGPPAVFEKYPEMSTGRGRT